MRFDASYFVQLLLQLLELCSSVSSHVIEAALEVALPDAAKFGLVDGRYCGLLDFLRENDTSSYDLDRLDAATKVLATRWIFSCCAGGINHEQASSAAVAAIQ